MGQKEQDINPLNELEVKSICFKIIDGFNGRSISDAMQRIKDTQDDVAVYAALLSDKSKFIFKHPEIVSLLKDLSFGDAFLVLSSITILLFDCTAVNIGNDHFRMLFSEHAEQVMDL